VSLQQNRRADRVDRTVLTIAGLAALAAGAAALAAGAGAFGDDAATATLLPPSVQDALDDHGAWFALGGAVLLGIIGVLAVVWLLFLLRPVPQTPSLRLVDTDQEPTMAGRDGAAGAYPERVPGRITLEPKALVQALQRELEALPGVTSATVRLPDRRPVEVHAALELQDGVDTASVLRAADTHVRSQLESATGLRDVHMLLELEPGDQRPSRVA
jgi:hypothetical protein